MNLVVVVNEKDEVIGTMDKAEAHKNGTPHRIAVVYVENAEGKILVQVRVDGLLDHSSAGHVDPGESYEEAARRELSEELGIEGIELTKVGHGMTKGETYADGVRSHVFDIFSCVAQPAALQEDEVHSVYWETPDKILEAMRNEGEKYCGGFKTSLSIYIANKK